MTPPFLTVLNGLSKSKSHLQEKVTPTPTPLAEFSNYAELCTFEYTWSTAEEGTSSPVHHLCVPPPIWVLFLFSFFFPNSACSNLDESWAEANHEGLRTGTPHS